MAPNTPSNGPAKFLDAAAVAGAVAYLQWVEAHRGEFTVTGTAEGVAGAAVVAELLARSQALANTVVGLRQRLARLLEGVTAIHEAGTCGSCRAPIVWVTTRKNGKRMPVTLDGLSHFADCVHADQHRKATP